MMSRNTHWILALACLVGVSTVQSSEQVFYQNPNASSPIEEQEVRPAAESEEESFRVLPDAVEQEVQERRASEAQVNSEEAVLAKPVKLFCGIDVIHPDTYHYPYSHAVNGGDITLQDLSKWSVSSYDRFKILNWASSDLIFIKPNTAWFSSYKYVLYNERTAEAAEVNLIRESSFMTFWIIDIDYYNGYVVLNDGTTWPLNSFDYSVYKYWRTGDRIIAGLNHMWRNGIYPYILINVDIKNAPYCESL